MELLTILVLMKIETELSSRGENRNVDMLVWIHD
jgi:hypothetical protein